MEDELEGEENYEEALTDFSEEPRNAGVRSRWMTER